MVPFHTISLKLHPITQFMKIHVIYEKLHNLIIVIIIINLYSADINIAIFIKNIAIFRFRTYKVLFFDFGAFWGLQIFSSAVYTLFQDDFPLKSLRLFTVPYFSLMSIILLASRYQDGCPSNSMIKIYDRMRK